MATSLCSLISSSVRQVGLQVIIASNEQSEKSQLTTLDLLRSQSWHGEYVMRYYTRYVERVSGDTKYDTLIGCEEIQNTIR